MRNDTREVFDRYLQHVEQMNGIHSALKMFTVEPSVQQTIEAKIQESSEFLKLINIVGVDDLVGEKIGLGISGPVISRTDTSGNGRRQTKDLTALDKLGYVLKQTDFDTHLPYAKLDLWSKFPNFQTLVQGQIVERCALDRIMVGWNGTTAAATTDKVNNPLGQDVNVGWLQKMRTENQVRVMDEGEVTEGKILVGPGGDYANLDALIFDAKHALLPEWTRKRKDLVAICGDGLLHDKYFDQINKDEKPTEQLALDLIMSSRRLGGGLAAEATYFPGGAVLITTFKNLSLYFQNGKRRRHIREAPDANRVEDFQSSNEGYVIEDYDLACMVENIEIIKADEA